MPPKPLAVGTARCRARAALEDHLQDVELEQGQVLVDVGLPIERIYFPHTCVVSLLMLSAHGDTVDVATIGCEGLIGLGGITSQAGSTTRQIVQVAGAASVIERDAWIAVASSSPQLQALVNAYREAFIAQIMQSVACNALHGAEARFARWLLMTADRSANDDVFLTHEFVAQMLGVRRPTITLLAQAFQKAELIENGRGRFSIVDRPGLEKVACECYGLVKRSYQTMLVAIK